jgi:hypothetical protein
VNSSQKQNTMHALAASNPSTPASKPGKSSPAAKPGKSSTARWRQKVSMRHQRIREIHSGLVRTGKEAHRSIVDFSREESGALRNEAPVEPEVLLSDEDNLWEE